MKRLAILFALVACTTPSLRPTSTGSAVLIPGAHLDEVRNAVVSQLTSKGYAVLSVDDGRVTGDLPIGSDMSGNYFSHRVYYFGEGKEGVTLTASAGFVDKSPLPTHYDRARDVARMAVQSDVSADLAAIKAQFTH